MAKKKIKYVLPITTSITDSRNYLAKCLISENKDRSEINEVLSKASSGDYYSQLSYLKDQIDKLNEV
jgi:hypothetical protein